MTCLEVYLRFNNKTPLSFAELDPYMINWVQGSILFDIKYKLAPSIKLFQTSFIKNCLALYKWSRDD